MREVCASAVRAVQLALLSAGAPADNNPAARHSRQSCTSITRTRNARLTIRTSAGRIILCVGRRRGSHTPPAGSGVGAARLADLVYPAVRVGALAVLDAHQLLAQPERHRP